MESTWESELSLLRDTQKNEFREWLNTVSEDLHSNETKITYSDTSTKLSVNCLEPDLEESFTIYLGTQMKTMHNIRLLVMDPIDLCTSTVDEIEGTFSRDPKRMQTALTMYSNNLSALVMVVGNRVRYSSDFMTSLAEICSKNCEFHFPDLDQQLQAIQDDIIGLNYKRFPSLMNLNSSENSASGSNELIIPVGSTNSGESTSDQGESLSFPNFNKRRSVFLFKILLKDLMVDRNLMIGSEKLDFFDFLPENFPGCVKTTFVQNLKTNPTKKIFFKR